MKKALCLFILAFMLAGCTVTYAGAKTPAAPTEGPSPDRITEVEGLTVDDVSAIYYFDDSQPPDTPVRIIYREKELRAMLQALQAIRLTGPDSPDETAAPGDYWSYSIILFDGRAIFLNLNVHRVITQDKPYRYQGADALQQIYETLGADPNLPGNDAYENVAQIRIRNAFGEITINDRERMDAVIRMFHHMTIEGRSRDELKDGTIYTFVYQGGSKIQLQFSSELLMTAEGTYRVITDSEFMDTVQPSQS